MLDDRKKKILQAIVEEYIETAEPVSSKALVQKHGIDYSSATIRNEMAELEKIGLIDKTHTSSGRIPSAQGYRYYVDELLNYNDISMQEIKYIQNQLEKKVNQIEENIIENIVYEIISLRNHYVHEGYYIKDKKLYIAFPKVNGKANPKNYIAKNVDVDWIYEKTKILYEIVVDIIFRKMLNYDNYKFNKHF